MTAVNANPLLPLKINRLDYAMGSSVILSNINLSVDVTGVSVILGHNGAGKSMLLKLLHGILPPCRGDISWGPRNYPTNAVRHLQAMVFQKPALLRRSVAANIQFVLDLPHTTSNLTCNELLHMTQLQALSGQPARSLSGGEQQRLAFARALACDPKVLFLDEPTANLDPNATLQMERLIQTASERNIKVLLVTHDIGQARRLAQEVIFLHDGSVETHCRANEFFTTPQTPYSQSFIDGVLLTDTQ